MAATPVPPFDFGTRVGILLITEFFGVSALAVSGLLAYIIYSSVKFRAGARRYWSTATHVHWYFMSLLISDGIQAVGGILSIKWIVDARVTEGPLCVTQGVLKQMGDVGVALATLAITIHTFAIIVFRWSPSPSPRFAFIVLGLIWGFLILIVTINGAIHDQFYGNTGYWCWITSDFPVQRIALEYFWMWFTSLGNIVLYAMLALVIKGYIVFNGWRVHFPQREDRVHLQLRTISGAKNANGLALQMLFYPMVYTCTVLPIAICRWSTFYGTSHVPFWATVLSDIIFASSGLFNVILFAVTRPMLLPKRNRGPSQIMITQLSHSNSDGHRTVSPTATRGRAHFHDPDFLDPEEPWEVASRTVTPDKPMSFKSHIGTPPASPT